MLSLYFTVSRVFKSNPLFDCICIIAHVYHIVNMKFIFYSINF
nr:MAG TPA: hypothetical protein [Caudoviricetes sp.]